MLSHFETRAQKAVFAMLAFALVALLGLTIASAATRAGATWPGFVVWRNLVTPAIGGPDWPGNRAGIPLRSILVAVDGVPVSNASELRAIVERAGPDRDLSYEFRHDGRLVDVAVPTSVLRWRNVLPVYLPYWIDGAAFFAVGLVVFYFRPWLPAARASLALGTVLGTVLLLASDVFSAFWLDALYFTCESLTPAVLLHLALCFPEEKEAVRRRPWLAWSVYLPFVPLAVLQVRALYGDGEAHLAINDWVYTAIAGAGLVSIASLVHTFFASRNPLARQQAKIVMAGVALAAFVPATMILAIVLLRVDLPMNLVAPFVIVYPLSIGYAIARHDLFSVDRYLRLGVVYAALSVVVFLSYALVVVGGESLLGAGSRLPQIVVPLYVLVVLLVFDPLRAAIQRIVDRLFYRQAVSYRATVEATSRVLASVLDSERVADTVLATLTDVMAIEWAVLVVRGDPGATPRFFGRPAAEAADAAAALDGCDRWLVEVGARRRPLSRYELDARGVRSDRDVAEDAAFGRLGTALAFPLRFESDPIGVLLLGEKKSGAFYSDDDLQLLDTLVHQAALALTNAHAYDVIRRTQAELVEAERLAAVGELASTVAHGIRNPLAGIRAAAQVAREELESDSPVGENLDDIIAETDRLEQRVRSILEMTRPELSEPVRTDPTSFLQSYVEGQRARLPRDVRIAVEVAPSLPAIAIDPTQLTEALDVLVTNAVEAMGGRGEVRIHVGVEANGAAGPTVAISVTDTGPGIEPGRIARVFELFYTSKPSGTGVGLAMAKRLVERQGGRVSVESAPGRGATFTFSLPADTAARA
ncbi:MAG TPA: ATP-binding protein [Candidatus Binatia bacterium]|nr:ATP-binding protein [Candidatus Binatia bacterium]